jgi:hypothetical protein
MRDAFADSPARLEKLLEQVMEDKTLTSVTNSQPKSGGFFVSATASSVSQRSRRAMTDKADAVSTTKRKSRPRIERPLDFDRPAPFKGVN